MAFEIYKYDPNCQEWEDIRKSSLIGLERDNAFDECVKKIGIKLSLQEFFKICNRRSDWWRDECYRCIGKPNNILEQLAYSELDYDDELSYLSARDNHPEDLCESRTDWDMMQEYADGLASFINRIKDEIARGRLVFNDSIKE